MMVAFINILMVLGFFKYFTFYHLECYSVFYKLQRSMVGLTCDLFFITTFNGRFNEASKYT
ncbi:hypothetical protein Hanom_Chr01g00053061 [Helianthus anomalus]